MSRRPLQHPIGRLAKAQQRMAPGGLLWSESPIPRQYRPQVPMLGDDPPATSVSLRPVAMHPDPFGHTPTLFGGGTGATTLRDASDTTYARGTYTHGTPATSTSLVATFEAATIGFVPFMQELRIRARSLSATPGVMQWSLAGNIYPAGTYTPYYGDNDVDDNSWSTFRPTSAWETHVGEWTWGGDVPTAADVAAGGIQVIIAPGVPSPAGSWDMDVADIELRLFQDWHPPSPGGSG